MDTRESGECQMAESICRLWKNDEAIGSLCGNGSYLRMKNINLGYKLVSPFKGIESINLFASVSNVFTISGYSWYDPDVNSFGSDASRRGVDLFSYPSSRTFSFGLQCTF